MAAKVMQQSAFYCGCGYGQRGDLDGKREADGSFPLSAQGWDGHTFVNHPEGEEAVCPNQANHVSVQAAADRDRLSALEKEVLSLRARVGSSPA